jgi:hypothetical protein
MTFLHRRRRLLPSSLAGARQLVRKRNDVICASIAACFAETNEESHVKIVMSLVSHVAHDLIL